MEVRKSKETLILTRAEKAVLLKARDMLDEIYRKTEEDGAMEEMAEEAKGYIELILKDTEVEDGEPHEAVDAIVFM